MYHVNDIEPLANPAQCKQFDALLDLSALSKPDNPGLGHSDQEWDALWEKGLLALLTTTSRNTLPITDLELPEAIETNLLTYHPWLNPGYLNLQKFFEPPSQWPTIGALHSHILHRIIHSIKDHSKIDQKKLPTLSPSVYALRVGELLAGEQLVYTGLSGGTYQAFHFLIAAFKEYREDSAVDAACETCNLEALAILKHLSSDNDKTEAEARIMDDVYAVASCIWQDKPISDKDFQTYYQEFKSFFHDAMSERMLEIMESKARFLSNGLKDLDGTFCKVAVYASMTRDELARACQIRANSDALLVGVGLMSCPVEQWPAFMAQADIDDYTLSVLCAQQKATQVFYALSPDRWGAFCDLPGVREEFACAAQDIESGEFCIKINRDFPESLRSQFLGLDVVMQQILALPTPGFDKSLYAILFSLPPEERMPYWVRPEILTKSVDAKMTLEQFVLILELIPLEAGIALHTQDKFSNLLSSLTVTLESAKNYLDGVVFFPQSFNPRLIEKICSVIQDLEQMGDILACIPGDIRKTLFTHPIMQKKCQMLAQDVWRPYVFFALVDTFPQNDRLEVVSALLSKRPQYKLVSYFYGEHHVNKIKECFPTLLQFHTLLKSLKIEMWDRFFAIPGISDHFKACVNQARGQDIRDIAFDASTVNKAFLALPDVEAKLHVKSRSITH